MEAYIVWKSSSSGEVFSPSPPLYSRLFIPPSCPQASPDTVSQLVEGFRGSSVSPRSDHSLLLPPSALTCPQAPPDAVSQLVEAFRGSAVAARDQTAIGERQMGAAMQGGGGQGAHGAHGRRGGGELRGLQKYEAGYLTQVWGRGRGAERKGVRPRECAFRGITNYILTPPFSSPWCMHWQDGSHVTPPPTHRPQPAGLCGYILTSSTQVSALAGRLGRHATRHPLLIGLNLVASAAMALGIGAIYWDTGRDTGGIQVGGGGGGGVMVLGIGAIYWDTGRDTGGIQVGGEGGGRRGGEGGRLGVD